MDETPTASHLRGEEGCLHAWEFSKALDQCGCPEGNAQRAVRDQENAERRHREEEQERAGAPAKLARQREIDQAIEAAGPSGLLPKEYVDDIVAGF